MKYRFAAKMAAATAILILVMTGIGCGSYGGADIYLENVNIGSVSMEGILQRERFSKYGHSILIGLLQRQQAGYS